MSKTKFRSTPDYRVVSTFAKKEDVDALLAELQAAGYKNDGDQIGVHHGEQGKDFIDPDGSRHGLFARLSRMVQRLPSWEASMLEQVEDALNSGQYVASVLTDGGQKQRKQIGAIMGKHTNQRIYYRGNYSMEIIREATDVTNNKWSQQVVNIEPFEIALADAPDFLGKWQQDAKRAYKEQGLIQAALNQSVEENPQFRYVNIGRWSSDAAFTGEGEQFLYRQAVEQVGYETTQQEHVYVINFMEVSADQADAFVEKWPEMSLPIAEMDGFIWATLYRAVDPNSRFQFVNYAQWHSAESHKEFVDQLVSPPAGVTIHSGIYRIALVSTPN